MKENQDIKNTKLSASLFAVASLCMFTSWALSGFEVRIWLFLAVINLTTAFIQWTLYVQGANKKKEGGRKS